MYIYKRSRTKITKKNLQIHKRLLIKTTKKICKSIKITDKRENWQTKIKLEIEEIKMVRRADGCPDRDPYSPCQIEFDR